MKIAVRMTRRPSGVYQAWCLDLPGCTATGLTREEAQSKMREAVNGYLASLGAPVPVDLRTSYAGAFSAK